MALFFLGSVIPKVLHSYIITGPHHCRFVLANVLLSDYILALLSRF